jgi:histidine transporter
VALFVGAGWLAVLVLAYQFRVRGNGRRRAELTDETSPLPVVSPVAAGTKSRV